MPVKYFVSKDSQGRQWPPDTSGEKKEVLKIIGSSTLALGMAYNLSLFTYFRYSFQSNRRRAN